MIRYSDFNSVKNNNCQHFIEVIERKGCLMLYVSIMYVYYTYMPAYSYVMTIGLQVTTSILFIKVFLFFFLRGHFGDFSVV